MRKWGRVAHLIRFPVSPEHVDPHDSLFEVRVRALHNIIVDVLLVPQRIQRLEDKLEKRFQVFWVGRSDKNVGIVVCEGGTDSETQSGGFATPTSGSESDSRGEGLFGDGVDKGEDRFGLLVSLT